MGKKSILEYRYYNMPSGAYILPLFGENWRREYGWDTGETQHFHNYFELGICHEGQGELCIEDRRFRFHGGMYTMIPANVPHTTKSDPGTESFWEFLFVDIEGFLRDKIQMDSHRRKELLGMLNHRGTIRSLANHPEVGELIGKIIGEYETKKSMHEDMVNAYLFALLIEMQRLDTHNTGQAQGLQMNACIELSLRYMDEHFDKPLKVEEISQNCGLSQSHFRRLFDQVIGVSPLEYLNMLRVEKACSLINEKDLSMEEVARRVGYQTPSTFNRNFKRVTGMQPMRWKQEISSHHGRIADFKVNVLKGWTYE